MIGLLRGGDVHVHVPVNSLFYIVSPNTPIHGTQLQLSVHLIAPRLFRRSVQLYARLQLKPLCVHGCCQRRVVHPVGSITGADYNR